MANSLKDFFDGKYQEITSLGMIDDTKTYTMEDYVELNKLDEQVRRNGIDVGSENLRVPNVDDKGFLLSTPRKRLVVNEDIAFINRIRVNKGDSTISIVIDYRAISEQNTGTLYTPNVLSYIIGKVSESKKETKYAVKNVETVNEVDFINEFKDTLKSSDSRMMYEVITHYKNTGTSDGISLDELF